MSSRWLKRASSGVKQPNAHGSPRSSETNAANICNSESEKPNSKMPPVIVGYCGRLPMTSRLHACSRPSFFVKWMALGSSVVKRAESLSPLISYSTVFVQPGAMRFISNSIGKRSPAASAPAHSSSALSHVSHGTGVPSGPGRMGTRLLSCALTLSGSRPRRKGRCCVWMPRSPMQP